MSKSSELTILEVSEVRANVKDAIFLYRLLAGMMEQIYSIPTNELDRDVLKRQVDLVCRRHAECSADVKAIARLVK